MPLPADMGNSGHVSGLSPAALYLQLNSTMNCLHRAARANLQRAKQLQKKFHDRKLQHTQFQVGDAVWLRCPATEGARKFLKPWRGPYRVIENLPPSNYRLRFWGRNEGPTQVVHHNRLKRCYETQRRTEPPIRFQKTT